ncbi:MAG: hypothetical protein AB7O24_34340 [Kofleriaceae bacterium]
MSKRATRAPRDPRIVEALGVLQQVFESDRTPPNTGSGADVHDVVMEKWLATFTLRGWPEPAVRAVVQAVLQHAPDEDFEAVLDAVRDEARWQVTYRRMLAAEDRLTRRLGRTPTQSEIEAVVAAEEAQTAEPQKVAS